MQHALQAAILLKAAELGPGQASSGAVAALMTADAASVSKAGEQVSGSVCGGMDCCGFA